MSWVGLGWVGVKGTLYCNPMSPGSQSPQPPSLYSGEASTHTHPTLEPSWMRENHGAQIQGDLGPHIRAEVRSGVLHGECPIGEPELASPGQGTKDSSPRQPGRSVKFKVAPSRGRTSTPQDTLWVHGPRTEANSLSALGSLPRLLSIYLEPLSSALGVPPNSANYSAETALGSNQALHISGAHKPGASLTI